MGLNQTLDVTWGLVAEMGERRKIVWRMGLSAFSLSCDALQSALLEEQKSVMQKCSEERRKLAAEWAEFHTRQQLSKERMERDMDRALQMDSHREGTIMSLAKVPQQSPFLWPPAPPGRLMDGSCAQGRRSALPSAV